MAVKQFANRASSTLAGPITNTATSLSVVSGGGAQFPTLAAGQNFTATLVSASNSNTVEIVLVTAHSTDTFTITRAQEGTTALAWNAGDYFNLLNTAGDMSWMIQPDDLQAQLGNYALDVGTANAYSATFSPAITAHIVGAPLRVKIANTNTSSTVTFNDGAGAATVLLPGGSTPSVGAFLAGGIATFIWDGTQFEAVELPTNITGIEQTITNLIYPVGAYIFWENDTTTPATVFTWQTWTEVQGVVLVGRNPSDPNFSSTGQTGGEDTHELVPQEIPPLNFQDAYYVEDSSLVQPGDQTITIGSLNHAIGSNSTDYNNTTAWFRNAATLSGTALNGTGTATPHNNLQPYRVVRMWRRTA